VKILANWSLVSICEITISPLMAWSLKKMVPDVYAFGSRMLIWVVSNICDTLIIT
jgi:hypothetical protein